MHDLDLMVQTIIRCIVPMADLEMTHFVALRIDRSAAFVH